MPADVPRRHHQQGVYGKAARQSPSTWIICLPIDEQLNTIAFFSALYPFIFLSSLPKNTGLQSSHNPVKDVTILLAENSRLGMDRVYGGVWQYGVERWVLHRLIQPEIGNPRRRR